MIETFFGHNALGSPIVFISSLIIGAAFGWCLEQAGFGSSKKVSGVFYFKDMSLIKVMVSAIITTALGLGFLLGTGIVRTESISVPDTILGAQIIGGLLFGVGFVIAGWSPATAVVGVGSGRVDAVFFLGGVLIGAYIFNLLFGFMGFWYSYGNLGTSFIYNELGFKFADFVLILTVVAVFVFWFSELIEAKFKFAVVAENGPGLWIFSVMALLGGCLIMAMGRLPVSNYLNGKSSVQTAELMQQLGAPVEKIAPQDLARELLEGQKKVALIDLRTRDEYDSWHIRGAVHGALNSLVTLLERYRDHDRIVFYSSDESTSVRALILAKTSEFKKACVLAGDVKGFCENVLKPASLRASAISAELQDEINKWRVMFSGSGMAVGAAEPVKIFNHGTDN